MYNRVTPMGSSHPALREGQSSRRKEISRLSELKRKTIAFKAMVFLFVEFAAHERTDYFQYENGDNR